MKVTPIKKQSKKAQRKHYSLSRRSWEGLKPVTRVVKSKKLYDRKKLSKPESD